MSISRPGVPLVIPSVLAAGKEEAAAIRISMAQVVPIQQCVRMGEARGTETLVEQEGRHLALARRNLRVGVGEVQAAAMYPAVAEAVALPGRMAPEGTVAMGALVQEMKRVVAAVAVAAERQEQMLQEKQVAEEEITHPVQVVAREVLLEIPAKAVPTAVAAVAADSEIRAPEEMVAVVLNGARKVQVVAAQEAATRAAAEPVGHMEQVEAAKEVMHRAQVRELEE